MFERGTLLLPWIVSQDSTVPHSKDINKNRKNLTVLLWKSDIFTFKISLHLIAEKAFLCSNLSLVENDKFSVEKY